MARNSGVVVAGGSSMESGPDQPDFATFQLSPVSTRPISAIARSCMAIWAAGPYFSSCRPELSLIQRAARRPRSFLSVRGQAHRLVPHSWGAP